MANYDGTNGPDVYTGTPEADVIRGFGGADRLNGAGGDDVIDGGDGDDILQGNEGNDTLVWASGADVLDGGGGDDTIRVARGITITQGSIAGGVGFDLLDLLAFHSISTLTIRLSGVEEILAQFDDVNGTDSADIIDLSGSVNRTGAVLDIFGKGGADQLTGSDGDDYIDGGAGNDVIAGGLGRDILDWSAGADLLDGGDGDDTLRVQSGPVVVGTSLRGGPGTDLLDLQAFHSVTSLNVTQSSIELISAQFDDINGTDSSDQIDLRGATSRTGAVLELYGRGGADRLYGTNGDDYIDGGAGDDNLFGDLGRDTLAWYAGVDILDGGEGDDVLIIGSGPVVVSSSLLGGPGNDRANFLAFNSVSEFNALGSSIELLSADFGDINGTDTADRIDLTGARSQTGAVLEVYGSGGDDEVTGADTADYISGGFGDDRISGGLGADTLVGGDGADRLSGGAGADDMDGGAGNDTFIYTAVEQSTSAQRDTIRNFVSGADRIDLNALYVTNVSLSSVNNQHVVGVTTVDGFLTFQVLGSFALSDLIYLAPTTGRTITGTPNADALLGGPGDDIIVGLGQGDTLTGGAGPDTFRYTSVLDSRPDAFDIISDFATGADKIDFGPIAPIQVSLIRNGAATFVFAQIAGGGMTIAAQGEVNGRDLLGFTSSGVFVVGDEGGNTLIGSDRPDTIQGRGGDDVIIGGGGGDPLFGEAGADTFRYLALSDSTAAGSDGLFGFETGVDRVDLTALSTGEVSLIRSGGATFLFARSATGAFQLASLQDLNVSDLVGVNHGVFVIGSATGDTVRGGAFADVIQTGDGADTIFGGGGADLMFGGAGADVFSYANRSDSTLALADTVFDFASGVDRIDLRGVRTGAGDRFGVVTSGPNSFLFVDLGGDGVNDMLIQLQNVALQASDVLF